MWNHLYGPYNWVKNPHIISQRISSPHNWGNFKEDNDTLDMSGLGVEQTFSIFLKFLHIHLNNELIINWIVRHWTNLLVFFSSDC